VPWCRRAPPGDTPTFPRHAPEQRAIRLAIHQQAADEFGATCSAGRAKKDGGRCWEGVVAMGVALGTDKRKSDLVDEGKEESPAE